MKKYKNDFTTIDVMNVIMDASKDHNFSMFFKHKNPMFDVAFKGFPDFSLLNNKSVINKEKNKTIKDLHQKRINKLVKVIIISGFDPHDFIVGNGEKMEYLRECLKDDQEGVFLSQKGKTKGKKIDDRTLRLVWKIASDRGYICYRKVNKRDR